MSEKLLEITSKVFAVFAAQEMEYEDREQARFTLNGQEFAGSVLGFASSRATTDEHKHNPMTPPPPGIRCSACRWAEVVILKTDVAANGKQLYAVFTLGQTVIPDEEVRVSETWTSDPVDVLRSLMVSSPANHDERGRTHSTYRRIPFPNAVAFRYAAEVDKPLEAVLDEYDDAIPRLEDRELGQRF